VEREYGHTHLVDRMQRWRNSRSRGGEAHGLLWNFGAASGIDTKMSGGSVIQIVK
jgi:hypothetical protein